MLRHGTSILLTTVIGAAIVAFGHAAESRGAEGGPPRNVLFIVSDDLNTDLGCYGHRLVQSPNVDRLAKRGMRFNRAYCQYPVCNPSRSSFMTGMYPEQTGVLHNGGDFRRKLPEVVTLPQLFQQHGYFVARVGKIFHYGVPSQIGTSGDDDPASWEHVVNPRGIDREVLDQVHTLQEGQFGGTLSWLEIDSQDAQHTDGIGATAAIDLLEQHHPQKTGEPFFLAVGFYRPHTPYVAPSHYFKQYPREKIEPVMEIPGDREDIPPAALADRPKQRELTVAQRREIIQAYFASISLMDAQLGRLLAALERLELAENTVVVFLSDHGYHLGRHGLWQKQDLFEGSCRVPLIIAAPGMEQAGEASDALVELVDLYPTLADVCGLPQREHLQGLSLTRVLDDPEAQAHEAALTVGHARGKRPKGEQFLGHSIRTPRFRYTEWAGGKYGVELYDYQSDPIEQHNLAHDPQHQHTAARLETLLERKKQAAR